jgi:phosphotransferase system HPr (HPr) family protein
MRTLEIAVADPVGLHARPAALFVGLANRFTASVQIRNLTEDGEWVNAKSILSLLTAGVKQDDRIEIRADGRDEEAALVQLEQLVRSGFHAEVG